MRLMECAICGASHPIGIGCAGYFPVAYAPPPGRQAGPAAILDFELRRT